MNLASAMATKAYLQVEGKERPKLELGDDPDKTGEYQMTFRVVNFGTEPLQYAITPTVLTERRNEGRLRQRTGLFCHADLARYHGADDVDDELRKQRCDRSAKGTADVTVTVKLRRTAQRSLRTRLKTASTLRATSP